MGKRGPQPKGKVKIEWSANFAYALGLLASDGCLSNDGRHITLVSKDIEQLQNFNTFLAITVKIGLHQKKNDKLYYRVQWSEVSFYNFLKSIGFSSAKSLTMRKILIQEEYFFDFMRGLFDGDGYSHSYFDKRWKSSFMLYVGFCSSAKEFIYWIRSEINRRINIKGHFHIVSRSHSHYQLKYAKKESLVLLKNMYYDEKSICLSRKKIKIDTALKIIVDKNMRGC